MLGFNLFCVALRHLSAFSCLDRAARQYHKGNKEDRDEYERVSVLVSTYEPKFWYGEAISLLHKLFFTGGIHLIAPGTRIQIWAGTLSSIMVLMLFILTSPFKFDVCDWVQGAALIQLMLTYGSASLVSSCSSLR